VCGHGIRRAAFDEEFTIMLHLKHLAMAALLLAVTAMFDGALAATGGAGLATFPLAQDQEATAGHALVPPLPAAAGRASAPQPDGDGRPARDQDALLLGLLKWLLRDHLAMPREQYAINWAHWIELLI
jgi:hypothetical protein